MSAWGLPDSKQSGARSMRSGRVTWRQAESQRALDELTTRASSFASMSVMFMPRADEASGPWARSAHSWPMAEMRRVSQWDGHVSRRCPSRSSDAKQLSACSTTASGQKTVP